MEIESTLSVVCGDLTGLLLLDNFSSRRECVSCEHGLVKPSTFERLAGKGHCKSWKKTVRCSETGRDIGALIKAGKIQLLDEPEWIVKRRETIEITKSMTVVDGIVPTKRKRGRPKKSESLVSINKVSPLDKSQEIVNQTSVINIPDSSSESGCLGQQKHKGKLGNGLIRKRKKLKCGIDLPKTVLSNKTIAKENGFVNGTNGFSSQLNGLEQSGAGFEVYKRVPRHGKCKRKRVRRNDFERSVNAIIRTRKTPTMKLRLACPVCHTQVQDSDALKYHDLMFHSSVSSKVFVKPEECVSNHAHSEADSTLGTSDNSFFELGSSDNEPTKEPMVCLPSLDFFKDKLTRGTVARLTSIGMESSVNGSCEGASSSKGSADSGQMSVLSTIAAQYQEILGISKDTLQQTSSLRDRVEALANSVEEIKSDVKDLSKTLALSNMATSAVRDDITAGDYQTFFNILEKFLNSNGFGNGR